MGRMLSLDSRGECYTRCNLNHGHTIASNMGNEKNKRQNNLVKKGNDIEKIKENEEKDENGYKRG